MLRFENKENGRFYYVDTKLDLLGDLVLTVIRGGKNSMVLRHYGFNDSDVINKEIEKMKRLRIKHGYRLV
jgi:hypothetical protein